MILNGIKFSAIVASPGIGKSYLCDNYKNFADLDEVRLRCRYFVPENITREELESTKGNRSFNKRPNFKELLSKTLNDLLLSDVTLIASPHPELIDFLIINNIKYCFVYPSISTKPEMIKRWKERGNTEEFIETNSKNIDIWYEQNIADTRPAVHYEIKTNEFLADVVAKAGAKLERK